MTVRLLLVYCVLFVFVSCKRQEVEVLNVDAEATTVDLKLYFPLHTGSYWIYQTYSENDTGFYTNGHIDSMYIEKDTIIMNNRYFKFIQVPTESKTVFRRDSLGYIVDETGRIFLSVTDFTDTLYSRYDLAPFIPIVSYIMQPGTVAVTTPAGTFSCFDYTGYCYSNPPYNSFGSPRLTHDYYAPNVGLLKMKYFFSFTPRYSETRLVRFKIAQ